jgi:hypothetical protein
MATLDSGIVIARNVKYDGPPQLDDDFFWAMLPRDSTSGDNVVTQGIRDHMLKNARDLFFRKDPSWAPEREFRIIVLKSSDGDFGVKVESALVGLVTGSEFGRMDSRLFTECRHRLKSLELARLTWDCGRPMIESW